MGLLSIVDYEDIIDATNAHITLQDATFKEAFGPFFRGERAPKLVLNYASGTLCAYDGKDKIKECKVALISQ